MVKRGRQGGFCSLDLYLGKSRLEGDMSWIQTMVGRARKEQGPTAVPPGGHTTANQLNKYLMCSR